MNTNFLVGGSTQPGIEHKFIASVADAPCTQPLIELSLSSLLISLAKIMLFTKTQFLTKQELICVILFFNNV